MQAGTGPRYCGDRLYSGLAAAGFIGWEGCVSEDRGDGAPILIPPEVPRSSSTPYKSIYSHVQGGFKSLQSLLRRTNS